MPQAPDWLIISLIVDGGLFIVLCLSWLIWYFSHRPMGTPMSASPSSVSPSFALSDRPFPPPAQVAPPADRYHLGSLSQTFRTKGRGQAIGGGIAVICFAVLLLLIGRLAGITGGGLFLASASCVIAAIVWMIKAGSSKSQRVEVFTNGLTVQTGQDPLIVVHWEEILFFSSQTPMTLTKKNGEHIVLQPTLQYSDELGRAIQRKIDRLHESR
jgi:hypothetical protein